MVQELNEDMFCKLLFVVVICEWLMTYFFSAALFLFKKNFFNSVSGAQFQFKSKYENSYE